MLSRRHRRKFRRFINEAVSAREKSATTGRLAKALNSLLQKPRPHVDFGYIEVPGRGAAIGPTDTHSAITDYLAEWHQADPALHDRDWEDFFATKEGFLRQMAGSPVPPALLDRIWDAFTPTLPEADLARMTAEMNEALSSTPPFEEFKLTLARKTTKGKAAGPSGTTYGMLALLDEDDLRVLYTAMARMWEAREVPALWKLRWMVPISKVPIEPSIDQLRPISLVETSRKLWFTMIIHRIRSAWHEYGALSDLQHGSRPCRGTDSASIQFINAIEECHVSCTPLFASSWDIRRAFDSLPKPLLCFAWTRLGVPLDIAQMIVAADTDGVTVVKSPTAVLAMSKEGPLPFLSATPPVPVFVATKGMGQGDVPSSDNWNAAYDILLTALSRLGLQHIWSRSADNLLFPVQDVAYADDLLSICPTLASLQMKADVVSAFAAVFRLEIVPSKLRAVLADFSNTVKGPQSIVIHDRDWNPTVVPLSDEGSFRYLGTAYDLRDDSSTQFKDLMAFLRLKTARLKRAQASTPLKLKALLMSVAAAARYPAKFCSLSLAQYAALETVITGTIKTMTRHMTSYPHSILYGAKRLGGHGMQSFVDMTNREKWSIVQRAHLAGGCTSMAAGALLSRIARLSSNTTDPRQQLRLTQVPRVLYLTSYVEWVNKAGLALVRSGVVMPSCLPRPLPPALATVVDAMALYSDADFTIRTAHGRKWDRHLVQVLRSQYGCDIARHLPRDPPQTPRSLDILQMWLVFPRDIPQLAGKVVEVAGYVDGPLPLVSVSVWSPVVALPTRRPLPLQEGAILAFSSPLLGAASGLHFPAADLLNGPIFRVIAVQRSPNSPLQRKVVVCSHEEAVDVPSYLEPSYDESAVDDIRSVPNLTLYVRVLRKARPTPEQRMFHMRRTAEATAVLVALDSTAILPVHAVVHHFPLGPGAPFHSHYPVGLLGTTLAAV